MRTAARLLVPLAVLSSLLVVSGCRKRHDTACAQTPESGAGAGASSKAWAGTTERWVQDWNAKRLDAVVAVYATDAVFLTATGARVTGQDRIRDVFNKAFGAATTDMRVKPVAGDASGDVAYESGDYEESVFGDTGRRELKGSYLTILKRAPDGRWLIVQQAWTEALPAK